LVDGIVIDNQDAELAGEIQASGQRVLVTQTIMGDASDRRRLAVEVLEFGRSLAVAESVAT
jgi:hypothetical protein